MMIYKNFVTTMFDFHLFINILCQSDTVFDKTLGYVAMQQCHKVGRCHKSHLFAFLDVKMSDYRF